MDSEWLTETSFLDLSTFDDQVDDFSVEDLFPDLSGL